MKTSNQDKFIIFQNKLYDAEKAISAMKDPFVESYNPSVKTLKESLISIFILVGINSVYFSLVATIISSMLKEKKLAFPQKITIFLSYI